MNELWKFTEDNEWYTTRQDVEYFLKKSKIPKNKIIWCPFDTDKSNFVVVLKEQGYNVINSHIIEEKDFYNYEPEKWDIIISNPPFKGKANIISRIIELGNKPFALIYGIQCFNSGGFTRIIGNLTKPQFVMLTKRLKFTKDVSVNDYKKLLSPTFHSMWICNNLFEEDLQIWDQTLELKEDK